QLHKPTAPVRCSRRREILPVPNAFGNVLTCKRGAHQSRFPTYRSGSDVTCGWLQAISRARREAAQPHTQKSREATWLRLLHLFLDPALQRPCRPPPAEKALKHGTKLADRASRELRGTGE